MDPQAKAFVNEQVRPIMDAFVQLVNRCRAARDLYVAQGMAAKLAVIGANPLDDGAAEDGRPVLTGDQVVTCIGQVETLLQTAGANGSAVLNVYLAGCVNPLPRG